MDLNWWAITVIFMWLVGGVVSLRMQTHHGIDYASLGTFMLGVGWFLVRFFGI